MVGIRPSRVVRSVTMMSWRLPRARTFAEMFVKTLRTTWMFCRGVR